MAEVKELLTSEDLNEAWDESAEKPVYIFKQSTTCPISTAAFKEFHTFAESDPEGVGLYFVKVRETREVSNEIADKTGVRHESPQAFLIKNKEAVWNRSHSQITAGSLKNAQ